ncbi:MAG: DUF5676 family membrane protein [Acidobacteriota bacterium]
MMKLDIRAFAIASALIAATLFVVCAFFVAIAPKETTAIAGHLIHADLSGIVRSLTWGNFFGGLAGWTLGTASVAGATAWLYNHLTRSQALK